MQQGCLLRRSCWCASCKVTCPVHVLGAFFRECGLGSAPFGAVSAFGVLNALRVWLGVLGIPDSNKFRTHDLRRGHARDLQASGASLYEILKAGEWRSSAFLKYLDESDLECQAAFEAHVGQSSDEEDDA